MAVYATPFVASSATVPGISLVTSQVKSATPEIILFNDKDIQASAEVMVDLLFENIGGQELLSISRNDSVNGQDVLYSPIKNLNIIQQEFNPNNIIKLQNTSDNNFDNFPIKLNLKVPNTVTVDLADNIYLDGDGNLVIELLEISEDEQVEVQITTSGTIYEVN
jgi:hypothetical protein